MRIVSYEDDCRECEPHPRPIAKLRRKLGVTRFKDDDILHIRRRISGIFPKSKIRHSRCTLVRAVNKADIRIRLTRKVYIMLRHVHESADERFVSLMGVRWPFYSNDLSIAIIFEMTIISTM